MVEICPEIINFLFFAPKKLNITQNKNLPNFFKNFFKNLSKNTNFVQSPSSLHLTFFSHFHAVIWKNWPNN